MGRASLLILINNQKVAFYRPLLITIDIILNLSTLVNSEILRFSLKEFSFIL
jgi:hypothetical protein